MQKLSVGFVLTITMAFIISPGVSVFAQPADAPLIQTSANDLIAAVNSLRVANGLPPYTVNSILMRIAQDQANYMAATGQVAHRPGLTQRILDAGYPLAGDLSQGGFRSENITGGNKTAAQAVQEWTGDALHTNTMLSPNLSEIGAGVAEVGGRYYMVIDCAQPTTGGIPQAFTPNPEDPVTESFAPGDFIVPVTTSMPDGNGLVYHEVQSGQTLWAIAIEYGVKIDEIRALNNLGETTEIYPGDRLLVRKDAPPPLVTANPVPATSRTDSGNLAASTPFPTATQIASATATLVAEPQEKNSVAGVVVGIVLVTLLFAGMFTWMSARKPV